MSWASPSVSIIPAWETVHWNTSTVSQEFKNSWSAAIMIANLLIYHNDPILEFGN